MTNDNNNRSAFVVSPDWLEQHLDDPSIRIVDAAWYLPAQQRDPKAEYRAAHIPGAVFFDQDAIADQTSGLPHTLPSPDAFAEAVGAMGISENDTIVVYDGPGIFTAPRVWWMFGIMGAKNVFVLDGGMDGWKADGRPTTTEIPSPAPQTFHASFDARAVTSFERMKETVENRLAQIADARSAGRFSGEEQEPRAGMRSGHMPGARSLPSGVFSDGGKLKDLNALRQIFANAGVDLTKPVVTTCGSGVTAAIITLALQSLGHTDNTLYDSSWSEWGGRPDTPVAIGRE
ncbi:3-mercaptopyruvate sulfurtransferase [Sinorhizobium fredii USDA 205]|uniref:3-mercaptopyruvate sulfurtransferase n=1 Tax=Rhizobium fredii TaxID=380 RepID=A0A844AKU6_RHIFR|nr:3-mercaptopyruvate sulfurtransferase [Sinorhizobium fredii]AWM24946.1 Thiosulfate sulfurtransferase rhodanese [Sinorhizobium fredii CCBAU 25509]KSV89521.1 3-mercaptopyruvate sulfurtransferase [Sinorhizobium fredii USDA 205]MCG5474649.1 3-mercaptopyruvate sulfurtransferase [Sinorhizobium fredii]MQW95433.1 3-mercaptopyruvate sulfurtransferase [Sinorhizobium fredii]MQW98348.1 3-mercaptopyruvate sulfurtransferase [Sinorhizobium fredii]